MSFWDNVKKFAQPYADDEFEDYDEEALDEYEDEVEEPRRRAPAFSSEDAAANFTPASTPSPAEPSPSFSGHVVNMNSSSGKQEVVLFHAKTFADATKAADELRSKKAVILNMENIDKALTRRVVDFLSGCVYALDGKVKKIAQSTYLFCPHSMDIVGDLENFQGEVESYV